MLFQDNRISYSAYTAFGIATFFYFFQYILRVFPSIAMQDMMTHFQVNTSEFGQFSGFYYVGYSALHLPIGLFLDRQGPKKVIPLCLILIGLGMGLLVFSTHWQIAILGRMGVGMGSSGAILGIFKVLHAYFPSDRFTKMLSFSVTLGLLGAIYGGGPLFLMLEALGFQQLVILLSASAFILAILAFMFMPDMGVRASEISLKHQLQVALLNPKVLFLCLMGGLMVGPLEGFADVWGKTFFEQIHGFSPRVAASLPSIMFFGMCFGGPILSFIAESKKNHYGLLVGCGILMLFGFLYMMGAHNPHPTLLTFILFGMGILSAYQIILIYLASTFVEHESSGLVSAVANMVIMTFGYFFHVVIGKVVYEMGLFWGIMVIPLGLLLGSMGLFGFWWYMKRNREKGALTCKI